MVERKLIVKDLVIEYEGLFDAAKLFEFIDDWFEKNGYEKQEVKHIERVKEKGRYIDYEVMPYKEISDYTKYEINIRTIINNLVDTKVKKGKEEFKINKGKIMFDVCGFLVTDREGLWETKPLFFFFRTMFDKFIHKRYTERFEKGIIDDVANLHTELKSYLNLNKYNTGS